MTLRVRVAGTTSSRRPLASGTAIWGAAAGAALGGAVDGRSRPAPAAATLPVGGPPSGGWGSAPAAGSWPRCSTNASTSSRRTRPPLPLPLTWLRSTSCSRASRRTSGDTPAAALPSPLPLPDRAAALSRPGRSLAAGRASGSSPWSWSASPACSASAPAPSSAVSCLACSRPAGASSASPAAGASASPPPPPPITASSAPTSTVSSAWTLIDWRTPETGEGTSVSTLSVEISNRGSSASTWSPSCLSQRVIVPSVIDSPSSGILIGVAIGHRLPGLLAGSELVEAASGKRHVGLADGFGQGRVGVDELGDVDRQGLPVVDQHRLGDQVGDPGPDQVDPEHRAVLGGNDLDHAPQAVDQALGGG